MADVGEHRPLNLFLTCGFGTCCSDGLFGVRTPKDETEYSVQV